MAIPSMGHTLGPVIADMEKLTGVEARRIHVDKGYRGHNHPHRFRVWISGQVRRVTASIRREMKRRAAVEPVIGHVKAEHRMDRNYLKGRLGDRINAVLAAAGYNFGLLLRWLAELLRVIIRAFIETFRPETSLKPRAAQVLHERHATSPQAPPLGGFSFASGGLPGVRTGLYFVMMGLPAAGGVGAAGEMENTTHAFQPSGRFWASNSL
jgi:hypothetical protein